MSLEIRTFKARETYALRHEVLWPNKPPEFVVLHNDEEGMHFGLLKDEHLISVISLFIKNNAAQFRKFATKKSAQGNGYGTILLRYIIRYVAKEKEIEKLWCNARIATVAFYERFGMKQTNHRFVKAGIRYVVMEKTTEHFE